MLRSSCLVGCSSLWPFGARGGERSIGSCSGISHTCLDCPRMGWAPWWHLDDRRGGRRLCVAACGERGAAVRSGCRAFGSVERPSSEGRPTGFVVQFPDAVVHRVVSVSCGLRVTGYRARVASGFALGPSRSTITSSWGGGHQLGIIGVPLVREQLWLLAGSQSRSTSVDGGGPFADDFGRRRTVTGSACEHLSGEGSSEQARERRLQVVFRTVDHNREEFSYRGSFGFLFEPSSVAVVCRAKRPVLRVGLSLGCHMVMSSLVRVGPARLRPACRTPRDPRDIGFVPRKTDSYWRGNARRALAPRGDRLLERETL